MKLTASTWRIYFAVGIQEMNLFLVEIAKKWERGNKSFANQRVGVICHLTWRALNASRCERANGRLQTTSLLCMYVCAWCVCVYAGKLHRKLSARTCLFIAELCSNQRRASALCGAALWLQLALCRQQIDAVTANLSADW